MKYKLTGLSGSEDRLEQYFKMERYSLQAKNRMLKKKEDEYQFLKRA